MTYGPNISGLLHTLQLSTHALGAQPAASSTVCTTCCRPGPAGPPSPLRIGVLKNAVNTSVLGLSPTDVFYVRQTSDGSGLSGGAIAGIAVGACAASATLAGAAWLALRRRQRRRQQQSPSAAAGDGDKEKAFTASCNSGGLADGSAQTSFALPAVSTPGDSLACAQPNRPAADGAAEGGGSSGYSAASAGSPSGSLPPLPPMRAGWNARPAPSPFAAQAATPFASGSVTPAPAGVTPGAATPGGSRNRHYGSGSRSPSVQPIAAAEAEAAAAAAVAAAAAGAAAAAVSHSNGGTVSSGSEETLPELVQHVAQCDAAHTLEPEGPSAAGQHELMSVDTLPPSLRVSGGRGLACSPLQSLQPACSAGM